MLLSRMSNAVAGFALVLITARALGPEGRGEIALVFTIAWATTNLADLGTHTSGRLRLLQGDGTIGPLDVLRLTVALLPFQVVLASGAVLVVSAFSIQFSWAFGLSAVLLSASTMAFNSMVFLHYGLRRYGAVLAAECVIAVLEIVGIIGLWYSGDLSSTTAVLVMAVVPAAGALWLGARSRTGASGRGAAQHPWRELVIDGFSPMLGSISLFIALRIDRILLAVAAGARSVGLFTIALAIPETLRIFPKAFGQVIADRGRSGLNSVPSVRRSIMRFTAAHWLVLGVSVVVGYQVLPVVFGDGFREARDILIVVTLAEALLCIHLMYQAVLVAFARPVGIGVPQVVGAVVVGTLDLVMIPTWGLQGAAWACVIGYGALALTSVRWADRELRRASP